MDDIKKSVRYICCFPKGEKIAKMAGYAPRKQMVLFEKNGMSFPLRNIMERSNRY